MPTYAVTHPCPTQVLLPAHVVTCSAVPLSVHILKPLWVYQTASVMSMSSNLLAYDPIASSEKTNLDPQIQDP